MRLKKRMRERERAAIEQGAERENEEIVTKEGKDGARNVKYIRLIA